MKDWIDLVYLFALFAVGIWVGSIYSRGETRSLQKESYMLIYEYGYLKGYSRGLDSTFIWGQDSTNFENTFIEKK